MALAHRELGSSLRAGHCVSVGKGYTLQCCLVSAVEELILMVTRAKRGPLCSASGRKRFVIFIKGLFVKTEKWQSYCSVITFVRVLTLVKLEYWQFGFEDITLAWSSNDRHHWRTLYQRVDHILASLWLKEDLRRLDQNHLCWVCQFWKLDQRNSHHYWLATIRQILSAVNPWKQDCVSQPHVKQWSS